MAKVHQFLLTVTCFLICTLALGQTVLTNDQILEMVNAKLTSSLIIGQIRNSKTNFDLSTSQMIRLSQAGVPEEIIAAMRKASNGSNANATGNTVKLPDGEKLRLVLAEDISSATANVGDRINFKVAEDLKVGDTVVISKGASAVGSITEAKKKGMLGRGGKLNMLMEYVKAVDNQNVRIRATISREGHENLGRVEEVGNAVDTVKVGDYVCLPFNIGCGFCANCERGLTGFCLTCAEPGSAGAAYGFAGMGPYSGGQAEYLRVPYADFNCLQLPSDVKEKENDYVMLSDIFPTGWHATRLAGIKPGDSVVIYGAGPVGLMAGISANIQGASKVIIVDQHPDRLKLAEKIGAVAIDDSTGDAVEKVLALTEGLGADW